MRKPLTYGTLPTREEFEDAFDAECRDDAGYIHPFTFTNDPRVGTCALTRSELWRELVKAQREWADFNGDGDSEPAGQWCSDVLGVLGFEWI